MAWTLLFFQVEFTIFRFIGFSTMKFLKIYILVFVVSLPFFAFAQNIQNDSRTPEQEAAKQTEKMQKELNLSDNQIKSIYDINLKYARERQQSNKRSDAVNRIKRKNEEIGRVLNDKQNFELHNKRSEIQSVEINGKRTFTRTGNLRDINNLSNQADKNGSNFQDRKSRNNRLPSAESVGESRNSELKGRNETGRERSFFNGRNSREATGRNDTRNSMTNPTGTQYRNPIPNERANNGRR